MDKISELLLAVKASSEFSRFFEPTVIEISGCDSVTVKVTSAQKITRKEGFKVVKHSYKATAETSSGLISYGFGESNFELLAIQKSISEAIERSVFKIFKTINPEVRNSNGWSAHLTSQKARSSSLNEVLERDTALLHWLSETPMKEICPTSWTGFLKNWKKYELTKAKRFNDLRILVSNLGNSQIVATLLMDKQGYGFVSQSAGSTLEGAILKSLTEVCRIADYSESFASTNSKVIPQPKSPEDHAVYYAYTEKLPKWLFGEKISFSHASNSWSKVDKSKFLEKESNFQEFKCGNLFISFCNNNELQQLYFGSNDEAFKSGLINLKRLENLCGLRTFSSLPHFVP